MTLVNDPSAAVAVSSNGQRDVDPVWGWNGMGEVVYARTYARTVEGENRRERWHETVDRCVTGAQAIAPVNGLYTDDELGRLRDHVLNLRGSFSGRCLWTLGTPMLDLYGIDGTVNCWATSIESIDDFCWVMDRLMVGGGVGFSVERAFVHQLPVVRGGVTIAHENANDADIIVPDKRQGWSRLLRHVLESYLYTGEGFTYSTTLLRPHGAPLKTFGGNASGPFALIDGITDICRVLDARAGKRIRSVDALDICNIVGRMVVAGSARRSAQIAGGDPDDALFLRAKRWDRGEIPAWRENSNNSLIVDAFEELSDEFWRPYEHNAGEAYGLLNRRLARTEGRTGERIDDPRIVVFNPCGEIGLERREPCVLSTMYLPRIDNYDQFMDIATLLYRTQKHQTLLWHPDSETRDVLGRNHRVGLSITGVLQATAEQRSWLNEAYTELRAFDRSYSARLGVHPSIKLTAIQPSGTQSLMPGVTPGLHAAYAPFYLRRVRFGANDPLVEACRHRGYTVRWDIGIDGKEQRSRQVVEFPCSTPPGTPLVNEQTAIEQLETLAWAQEVWADNAVSVTVSYKPEELPDIKRWLAANFDHRVKSVSFLRYEDHNFPMAPYERITEQEYRKRCRGLNLSVPLDSAGDDPVPFDGECGGGACPVR